MTHSDTEAERDGTLKKSGKDYPPNQVAASPEDEKSPESGEDARGVSWLAALTGIQTLKELLVIIAASTVLIVLLTILSGFFSSITGLFNEAAKLHSAPVAVVRTFDWHLVLLGVSLIVGISAIVIVLLKSVFNGGGSERGTTEDGLKLADLPLGQLISSLRDLWKELGKK